SQVSSLQGNPLFPVALQKKRQKSCTIAFSADDNEKSCGKSSFTGAGSETDDQASKKFANDRSKVFARTNTTAVLTSSFSLRKQLSFSTRNRSSRTQTQQSTIFDDEEDRDDVLQILYREDLEVEGEKGVEATPEVMMTKAHSEKTQRRPSSVPPMARAFTARSHTCDLAGELQDDRHDFSPLLPLTKSRSSIMRGGKQGSKPGTADSVTSKSVSLSATTTPLNRHRRQNQVRQKITFKKNISPRANARSRAEGTRDSYVARDTSDSLPLTEKDIYACLRCVSQTYFAVPECIQSQSFDRFQRNRSALRFFELRFSSIKQA
ncbi:unnamed protein product, partial [Amoebophrya sp. A120]